MINEKIKKLRKEKQELENLKKEHNISNEIKKVGDLFDNSTKETSKLLDTIIKILQVSKDDVSIESLLKENLNKLERLSKNNKEELIDVIKSLNKQLKALSNIKLKNDIDYTKIRNGFLDSIKVLTKIIIDINLEPDTIDINWNNRLKKPREIIESYEDYQIKRTIEYTSEGKIRKITNVKE